MQQIEPGKKTANKKLPNSTVALYISNAIDASGKTQRLIAEEVGYNRPNIISMLKSGEVDLPINKIEPLAKSLDIDVSYLLSLVLREKYPDVYRLIAAQFSDRISTYEERTLLDQVRNLTGSTHVCAETPEELAALKVFADLCAKRIGAQPAVEVKSDAT